VIALTPATLTPERERQEQNDAAAPGFVPRGFGWFHAPLAFVFNDSTAENLHPRSGCR
jgi:hypothetical protein